MNIERAKCNSFYGSSCEKVSLAKTAGGAVWLLVFLAIGLVHADGWISAASKGDIPSARVGHAMVRIGTVVYLFGGRDQNGELLNDLYRYDTIRNRWFREEPINSPPPARQGHSAVAYQGSMYIFFGEGSSGVLSDIWAYSSITKSWLQLPSQGAELPAGRLDHASALCGDVVVIYGGRTTTQQLFKSAAANEILGDTWKYNLKDGSWAKGSVNPYNRYGHSMVSSGDKVYSYGGTTAMGVTTDFWVYNVTYNYWSQIFPQGAIPGRMFHVADFDEQNKNMWICGGSGGSMTNGRMLLTSELAETWCYDFNSNKWLRKADGPAVMNAAGVIFPSSQSGDLNMVVFGGLRNNTPQEETFIYHASDMMPKFAVHIVVLGSSTAEGIGPSDKSNAWVNRYRTFLKTENVNHQVFNLAKGGYTTFHILPTGQAVPANRPNPDPQRNITQALSLLPDAIIINLPSNDANANYSVVEQLQNYDSVLAAAWRQKVPVWITTTQPRNLSSSGRKNLMEMRDSTFSRFGKYALDFWTQLARDDGTIRPEYDSGDGVHLNDAAHEILFQRVQTKEIHQGLITRVAEKSWPQTLQLLGNYPNPFNAVTKIEFESSAEGVGSYEVINLLGRPVLSIRERAFYAGRNQIIFDAREWPSGIYFYQIRVGQQVLRGKMSCVK